MSHSIIAISEDAFKLLFAGFLDEFSFANENRGHFGNLTASYEVKFHLEGGSINFREDNTIEIKELDIKWDILKMRLGFDIPELCIGGGCIIRNPINGKCSLKAPKFCIFSSKPDIDIPINIGHMVTSEVSIVLKPVIKYFTDPNRPAGMSNIQAKDANLQNKWQIFIDPVRIDIDVFDIADMIGDTLETAINNALSLIFDNLPVPKEIKDILRGMVGGTTDLLRRAIDLPDDIGEWLSGLLGTSLGLFNFIVNAVSDYFAAKKPFIEIEDPVPIEGTALNSDVKLIPVMVPVSPAVHITDKELVIEIKIGGIA